MPPNDAPGTVTSAPLKPLVCKVNTMKLIPALYVVSLAMSATTTPAQSVFPPGGFSIDGMPLVCGGYPTVLTTSLRDGGYFNGQAIILNPALLAPLPTPLKLYIYAHECAHGLGKMNEADADCWAIQIGRDQGWFPPDAFFPMMQFFENNTGSARHPPGPVRVQNMIECYQR